jgi:hypothetical protein
LLKPLSGDGPSLGESLGYDLVGYPNDDVSFPEASFLEKLLQFRVVTIGGLLLLRLSDCFGRVFIFLLLFSVVCILNE